MTEIPYGYCHCGCGEKTRIAPQSVTKYGYVKGEPVRFILGHHNRISVTPSEYFWSRVDQSNGENGCWNWMGSLNEGGYGRFHVGKKQWVASRFAYTDQYGEIPQGLYVCHSCDNPKCCNPNHLFLGSLQDNIHDMVQKGRQAKGQSKWLHKLNPDKVRYIRTQYSSGLATVKELAQQFEITETTIRNVINNKTWKFVTLDLATLASLTNDDLDAMKYPDYSKK